MALRNIFVVMLVVAIAVLGGGCSSNLGESASDVGAANPNACLQFDGVNDAVAVPHTPVLKFGTAAPYTLECWFKTSATTLAQAYAVLIGTWTGATGPDPYPYELRLRVGDQWTGGAVLEFADYDGSLFDAVLAQGHWNDGVWHHVAAVRWGTTWMGLYVDGTLRTPLVPNPNLGPITNTRPVTIGGYGDGWCPFPGLIDEVRIWDSARTARQIRQNRNTQLSGTTRHLVGYWKFNELRGLLAKDATPNHNNGALLNGPVRVPAGW